MKDLQTTFPWLKALFHTQYCGMLKIDLHVCSSKTLTHKPILGIDFQLNLDSFACTACRKIPCQKLCLYFVSIRAIFNPMPVPHYAFAQPKCAEAGSVLNKET